MVDRWRTGGRGSVWVWVFSLVSAAVVPVVSYADQPAPRTASAGASDEEPALEALERAAFLAELHLDDESAFVAFGRLWRACVQARAWVRAQVALYELEETASRTGRRDALLERFAAKQGLPPWLEAEVQKVRARTAWALGKVELARNVSKALGWIERWAIAGPFDNQRGGGFDTRYRPEQPGLVDLTARYRGKVREVGWRFPETTGTLGVIDLDALMRPNDEALAYALTYLRHEGAARRALLWIGSDEGVRVFWNDEPVLSRNVNRRFAPDQDACPITIRPGWNKLLVKVCERNGEWKFSVRITDLEGRPLRLENAAERRFAGVERLAESAAADSQENVSLPTPSAELQERVRTSEADAWDWFHLGYLSYRLHAHDENEHPARDAFGKAARLAPDEPIFSFYEALVAGRMADVSVHREDDPMRRALMRTIEADPKAARAHLRLGRYHLRRQRSPDRAERDLRAAMAAAPQSLELRLFELELAHARHRVIEPVWIVRTLEELPGVERSVHAQLALARQAEEQERYARAIEFAERAVEIEPTNRDARLLLVRLLLARGALDPALEHLERALALAPLDSKLLERRASVLFGHGRYQEAAAAWRSALEIAPEDAGWWEQLGRALLEAERSEEALSAFDRALELDPNNVALRRYLKLLSADEVAFEEKWRLDGEKTLELARSIDIDPRVTARVLLDHHVIRVQRDGRSSHFVQRVVRLENEDGVARFDRVLVPYAIGEQQVTFRRATVIKPDGRRAEARIRTHGARVGRAGSETFQQYGYESVDLPPCEVGDIVWVEYRTDDVVQSFFGDYFGHVHMFQSTEPVLRSRLVLLSPLDRKIFVHSRPAAIPHATTMTADGAWAVRIWDESDLAAIEVEPDMPPLSELARQVQISTFGDWNAFARWYWNLIRKQHEVSPEMRAKVEELTAGCEGRDDKIRAIYEFVVQQVRYNDHWEFGVHGFKPYNAASIFSRRFGDCKDKATLIDTMLGVAGIEAHPVLIKAERRRSNEDLTLPLINHFNHCISFVPGRGPNGQDGWFLDGTAQYHEPRSLPGMDAGARVVVITPRGALLRQVGVPRPVVDNGLRERRVAVLQSDHSAELQIDLEPTGDFAALIREAFANPAQRKEVVKRIYSRVIAGVEVLDVDSSDLADLDVPVRVQIRLRVPNLLEKGNGAWVLKEVRNPLVGWLYAERLGRFASKSERRSDLLLPTPMGSVESFEVVLPPELGVEQLPKGIELDTEAGRYVRRVAVKGKTIEIVRRLELKAQRIPAKNYPAWRAFAIEVDRSDQRRVRLHEVEARD